MTHEPGMDTIMGPNHEHLETEPLPAQAQAPFSILNMAWRRKSLILLGVVVGLVWGALDYAQRPPVYKVDAQVLVVKKRPDILPVVSGDASFSYYEDYLTTHQILIRSLLVAGRAARKPGIAGLKSFGGAADPTNQIIGALTVNREVAREAAGMAPNILNLSIRGQVREECALVLGAVIESYKDFLDETYRNVSDDTLDLITKARDVLQKDLAEKAKEYREFRKESPLFWKGKGGVSFAQERLGSLETKLSNLFLQRTELQGRLAAIDKALKEGQSRQTLAATLRALPSSGEGTETSKRLSALSFEEQLLPLLQQEETLLEDFGPNHPQVQTVRRRIALTRKLLARSGTERNSPAAGPGEAGEVALGDPVTWYVQSLKQELSDIEILEGLLAERLKVEYEEAKRLANYESREETFREEIARGQQLYDGIIKRLQEINIVKDFGGYYARVITPPSGGRMVEPRALPIFSVAIFLGMLGGFGLAYLADRSDKSFRTPEEIQRHLGVPVVGHISRITAEEATDDGSGQPALDPVLAAYHRARSPEAEAYRGVRTALYFSSHGKDYKLLQVTSPGMGDGKTTTVANLGISIAQSGKRILLIDADFRRPRLHELFGLSAPTGLASVLAGEAPLEGAIQETAVPGLFVLPCGPIPPNPAELLTSPRFQEVLSLIRDRYDLVLIDTPPMLAVSDPAVVAPRVEGVLIVLRYSKDGRPSAQRAKQILDTLGVTVLGVVVNAVDYQSAEGKYGYVRHRYSYGYGYGDVGDEVNGNGHSAPRSAQQGGNGSPSASGEVAGTDVGGARSGEKPATKRRGRRDRPHKQPRGGLHQSLWKWLRDRT